MGSEHNEQLHQTVILFTRYPRAGKVKTRLTARLGPEGAAELHSRMTKQVIGSLAPLLRTGQVHLQVYYCGGSEEEIRSWLGNDIHLARQQGNNLGERMHHAFAQAWRQGAERVLLIGSDCPGITSSIIESGLRYLESHDLVLGPAADGGYYLIGLRADVQQRKQDGELTELLFRNSAWGTGQVLRQTVRQAEKAGLSFALLPELHDIDRPEDLVHFHYHPGPQ